MIAPYAAVAAGTTVGRFRAFVVAAAQSERACLSLNCEAAEE
jgi:hypothetical protein